MNYPEYVEIEGKRYKINTNFKVAIECNKIAKDTSIRDYERALAIIYKLFGEEGLNDFDNHEKLLELGQKYLTCGKGLNKNDGKPDMDYEQDYGLIWASFLSDYNGLDIDKTNIHWWKFNELISGLSNSELGNCCILNKIRNIRSKKLSEIKDPKEKDAYRKLQKEYALKNDSNTKVATEEQKKSAITFLKAVGMKGSD